jgi:diaminohydroxyphosphoribosylaminopyrimidine deaminase/5-amino-6-(5-phosphoribosylamino)uracil reductase
MVGCVIARGGRILAEGWHHAPGGDHAEVAALRQLGFRAPGATAYITLEPCNHHGRTGPCTEVLLAAGIARVVYAMRDPNPLVAGKGRMRLRRAHVAVEEGLLGDEAAVLNRGYVRWVTTRRPWVTLKAAVSLDGRIATRSGDSKWLSGELSRRQAHRLRGEHDAILVGAGTVRADDPQLNVRGVPGHDPQRVILDGRLRTPRGARAVPGSWIFTGASGGAALEARGATVVRLGAQATLSPRRVLAELGRREITSVLIEGGGQVHAAFLRAGVVDEVALFVVPMLIGGDGVPLLAGAGAATVSDAWRLAAPEVIRLADDLFVRGRPQRG